PGAWLMDELLNDAVGIVGGAVVVTSIYLIAAVAKRSWWIWGTGIAVLLFAFYIFVAPATIERAQNTYTPLAESSLKHDILAMAQANGVPADNVYVFDQSKRSPSITANVSGLGPTTRVAIADTLLRRCSPACVRAVVGHELGHYVLAHTYLLLVMNALLT